MDTSYDQNVPSCVYELCFTKEVRKVILVKWCYSQETWASKMARKFKEGV